jgi:translation initiation factor IF-2
VRAGEAAAWPRRPLGTLALRDAGGCGDGDRLGGSRGRGRRRPVRGPRAGAGRPRRAAGTRPRRQRRPGAGRRRGRHRQDAHARGVRPGRPGARRAGVVGRLLRGGLASPLRPVGGGARRRRSVPRPGPGPPGAGAGGAGAGPAASRAGPGAGRGPGGGVAEPGGGTVPAVRRRGAVPGGGGGPAAGRAGAGRPALDRRDSLQLLAYCGRFVGRAGLLLVGAYRDAPSTSAIPWSTPSRCSAGRPPTSTSASAG